MKRINSAEKMRVMGQRVIFIEQVTCDYLKHTFCEINHPVCLDASGGYVIK